MIVRNGSSRVRVSSWMFLSVQVKHVAYRPRLWVSLQCHMAAWARRSLSQPQTHGAGYMKMPCWCTTLRSLKRSSRLSNHHLGARFWQNVCGVDSTVSEAARRSSELSPKQRPRAALSQSKPDLRVADSQEICRFFHETLR